MSMVDAQQRKFTFRQALGQGGFGEVYLAEMRAPSGLTSTVAVKVLHAGLDPASQAVMRLTDEGRILSMLNHPGIVAVHDLAVLEGRVALITEFVEGADLPDCLDGPDPMPRGAIYEAFAAVADALHAAHEAVDSSGTALGLLHRDIKPRNIRVGRHGQVKLLDFGIATASGLQREAQTGTNALIGSFPYMAPERFKRKDEVDRPSDIYSLGCSLYELLTREKLFYQNDIAELLVPKTVEATNREFLDERFERLRSLAPEALPLLTGMLALAPGDRPKGPAVVAALEDLAADVGGTRIGRWARAHDWGNVHGEPGPLSGREIIEVSGSTMSDATWHEPAPPVAAPPPKPLPSPTLEPEPAGTDTTNLQRGLGAAALLSIGGGVFLAALLGSITVALYLYGQDTAAPVEPTVQTDPEQPTEPAPIAPTEPRTPAPEEPAPSGQVVPVPVEAPAQPVPPTPAVPTDDEGVAEVVQPTETDEPAVVPAPAAGDVERCGALSDLELAVDSGRLSSTQRSCLSGTLSDYSLKPTDRGKLGRILLRDAQARCRAGDCADYEREQPRFLEEVTQSDPDMVLSWAAHQFERGAYADTRRWIAVSLERKNTWSGAARIRNLDKAHRLDAYAATRLWQAAATNESLRAQAKDAATRWANVRANAGLDAEPAMKLCAAAAGSRDACNARVHDRAATREVRIGSVPGGAVLRIDGEDRGTTPYEGPLSYGDHTLELVLDGETIQKQIEVGTASPRGWAYKARSGEWSLAY